jgi:hypothetical protein
MRHAGCGSLLHRVGAAAARCHATTLARSNILSSLFHSYTATAAKQALGHYYQQPYENGI